MFLNLNFVKACGLFFRRVKKELVAGAQFKVSFRELKSKFLINCLSAFGWPILVSKSHNVSFYVENAATVGSK